MVQVQVLTLVVMALVPQPLGRGQR